MSEILGLTQKYHANINLDIIDVENVPFSILFDIMCQKREQAISMIQIVAMPIS